MLVTTFIECEIISEDTENVCRHSSEWGTVHWTAGRRNGAASDSAFAWRVGTSSDTASAMSYTNWDQGQPNDDGETCTFLTSGRTYKWHDAPCRVVYCSVCELDI